MNRRLPKNILINGLLIIAVMSTIVLIVWSYVYVPRNVAATMGEDAWMSQEPLIVERNTTKTFSSDPCWPNRSLVTRYLVWSDPGVETQLCTAVGEHLDIGTSGHASFIGLKNQVMGVLNEPMLSVQIPQGTDVALYNLRSGNWNYHLEGVDQVEGYLRVYNRASESLQAMPLSYADIAYRFDRSKATYPSDGREIIAEAASLSSNGKYLVYSQKSNIAGTLRLVFVDLQTNKSKVIGFIDESYVATTAPLVSSNGRYVVVPYEADFKVWSVGGMCGSTDNDIDVTVIDPCPMRDINLGDLEGCRSCTIAYGYVTFDDDALRFLYGRTWPYEEVVIRPAYHEDTPPVDETVHLLDYLALGDSYSSGEGDIGKNSQGGSYYRTLTDVDNYNCHVSSRSYPFLLSTYYNIDADRMQSVACSGAKVFLDYYKSPTNYYGQNNRIANKSSDERTRLQQDALEHFIPGLTPQLEFVKKYQPKVITLTGGGNDVGFGDILTYCAWDRSEHILADVFYGLFTCDYAKPGSDLQKMLASSIRDQYNYNKKMIDEIQKASPDTQIYIIGYPQFVAEGTAICSNSLVLNSDERAMIYHAVEYLNIVLKNVAVDTQTHYIDIADSLVGGRLCEGSRYVTGINDVNFDPNRSHEIFHPNSAGHQQMAKVIERTIGPSLIATSEAESAAGDRIVSSYFGNTSDLPTSLQGVFIAMFIQRGQHPLLTTDKFLLAPGSTATVTIHSTATPLGTFRVNNDGQLSESITIPPTVEPGRHVITISGTSSTGEPINFYQFVTVTDSDSISTDILDSNSTSNMTQLETSDTVSVATPDTYSIVGGEITSSQGKLPFGLYHDTPLYEAVTSKQAGLDWKPGLIVVIISLIATVTYVLHRRRSL